MPISDIIYLRILPLNYTKIMRHTAFLDNFSFRVKSRIQTFACDKEPCISDAPERLKENGRTKFYRQKKTDR